MKKLLVVVFVALLMVGCGDPSLDEPVLFKDANLEAAVREHLKKPEGVITRKDMASLEQLSAIGVEHFGAIGAMESGITDLSGLQYAINLKGLDLKWNQITDLAPLSKLTDLKWMILLGNPIPDDQKAMLKKALPDCDIHFD